MSRTLRLVAAAFLLANTPLQAQDAEGTSRRHFAGSSAFVLSNFLLTEPPDFYQLNFGRWLTGRDVLSVEAITWRYDAPLGIPYGPDFGSPDEDYPGYVRAVGVGVAYQRFLGRSLYGAVHAVPMLEHYVDEDDVGIQDGFQLFLTLRVGYHFRLQRDRFFLEPSVAFTHWPINTNVPAAFAARDREWPTYFLFEPGLHFGVKF